MFAKYHRLETFSLLFLVAIFFTGCANHLEDGWKLFSTGKYNNAQLTWEKAKDPPLSELIEKAKAAKNIVSLHAQILSAEKAADKESMLNNSIKLMAEDKWSNKDWLQKSPDLKKKLADAKAAIKKVQSMLDQENIEKMTALKEQKQWVQITDDYATYAAFCDKYKDHLQVNEEIRQLLQTAEDEIEAEKKEKARIAAELAALKAAEKAKKAKIVKAFNTNLNCGKKQFLAEKYKSAAYCLKKAKTIAQKNSAIKLNLTDVEYFIAANTQAIKIQKAIEVERKKIAEERRLKEEKLRKAAAIKIAAAKKAKAERLRKEEEKRRKEAEEKRITEEKNRKWRAFLKKGRLLKPLVVTVGTASTGNSTLRSKKAQKWQAGSQLPKPKNKAIASEDVYALGISTPRQLKLTYLRNYTNKSSAKNLLREPQVQGNKRFYYTEKYKGGRFYTEIKNKKGTQKYQIKAIIYKIPVTN